MENINSNEALMVWLMNQIAKEGSHHAVLKGGMVLRLLECPRHTNDLDYVFVPYKSKKEILPYFEKVTGKLEGAVVDIQMHSSSLRVNIKYKEWKTQIEATVADQCKSDSLSNIYLAQQCQQVPQVIRVMSLDWALSHKLAAWNERGLKRDLYDIYFIFQRLKTRPDLEILQKRLGKVVYSKSKKGSGPRQMPLDQFVYRLEKEIENLEDSDLKDLSTILEPMELVGLSKKMKIGIQSLVDRLREGSTSL